MLWPLAELPLIGKFSLYVMTINQTALIQLVKGDLQRQSHRLDWLDLRIANYPC
ncbi:Uncharacterised protein [Serratia odorifera]|nr:Uncharacterised protein [Serratia odorifera]